MKVPLLHCVNAVSMKSKRRFHEVKTPFPCSQNAIFVKTLFTITNKRSEKILHFLHPILIISGLRYFSCT